MIQFKPPTNKTDRELIELVNEAMANADYMIGDLTERDAQRVVELLERKGYQCSIETETDRLGALVDSNNSKLVKFNSQGDTK